MLIEVLVEMIEKLNQSGYKFNFKEGDITEEQLMKIIDESNPNDKIFNIGHMDLVKLKNKNATAASIIRLYISKMRDEYKVSTGDTLSELIGTLFDRIPLALKLTNLDGMVNLKLMDREEIINNVKGLSLLVSNTQNEVEHEDYLGLLRKVIMSDQFEPKFNFFMKQCIELKENNGSLLNFK